jgi:hypothetical protein
MKTFGGVKKLIRDLDLARIEDPREYTRWRKRLDPAYGLLRSAFANPAVQAEADRLKGQLTEALYRAYRR